MNLINAGPINKKIISVMQVRNGERFLRPTLERLSRLPIASILVLDDGSTDSTVSICKEFSKVKLKRQQLPFNEVRNRNLLLNWAKRESADWIWISDCDEIAEDKLDQELMNLVNPENPEILAYVFPFFHFWNPEGTKWRADGLWGQFRQIRLFKNLPNQTIEAFKGSVLSASAPFFSPENIGNSRIRIKHYGNQFPELRRKKYEFWTARDTASTPIAALGNWVDFYKKVYHKDKLEKSDFYRHLIDESTLELHNWIEDNSVSLCIIAKDAEKQLPVLFSNVGPIVDEIILGVDSRTKDKTREVAKAFGAKVIDVEFNDSFSAPRNKTLKNATSSWILRMDSITGERCVPIKANGQIEILPISEIFDRFKDKARTDFSGKEVIENPPIETLTAEKVIFADSIPKITPELLELVSPDQQRIYDLHVRKGLRFCEIAACGSKEYDRAYSIWKNLKKRLREDPPYRVLPSWKPVRRLIRHKTNKQIYHFRQCTGMTKITQDHSLIMLKGGKLLPASLHSVKNSRIPSVTKIDPGNREEVDIRKVLSKDLVFLDNFVYATTNAGKTSYLHGRYATPSPHYIKKRCFLQKLRGPDLRAFLRVLGAYISEGSISDRDFAIYNQSREWLIKIKKELGKITRNIPFKIEVATEVGQGFASENPCLRLRSSAKILRSLFGPLCGVHARHKKIPSFIFSLKPDLQKIFLETLMEGDGYRIKGRENQSTYTTTSLQLCSGLCFLLAQLDRPYALSYLKARRAYVIFLHKTGKRHPRSSKTWVEQIENEENTVYDIEVSDSHIFLDACGMILLHNSDEICPSRDLEKLWNLRNFGEVDGFIFPIRNWLENPFKPDARWVLSETIRLFKNSKDFYYENIVHEELDSSVRAAAKKRKVIISRCDVMLEHTGFLKKEIEKKLEWYNKLNEKQLQLTPNNGKVHFDIANHYLHIKKYDKARNHFQKAIKLMPELYLAYTGLSEIYRSQGDLIKAIENLRTALRYCPRSLQIQRKRIKHNIFFLEEALEERRA